MLPGMEMLACRNLAVSPEVMQHIVQVESGANPYAIGVVDGQLVRQPNNMAEAVATAQMLESKGYNYSLGIAQVNRSNLGRYGLDSYKKAFNTCDNLAAGAQILARCYSSAGGDWGKAFSCYYSGNFTTGFRDGYVQKVYASINRDAERNGTTAAPAAPANLSIPLVASVNSASAASVPAAWPALRPVVVYGSDSTQYRVALRSLAIDTAAAAMMPLVVSSAGYSPRAESSLSADIRAQHPSDSSYAQPAPPTALGPGNQAQLLPNARMSQSATASAQQAFGDGVFEPQVRGPNDPPTPSATATMGSVKSARDAADLRIEQHDASFVF